MIKDLHTQKTFAIVAWKSDFKSEGDCQDSTQTAGVPAL